MSNNNLKKPFYTRKKDNIKENNTRKADEIKKEEDNLIFSNKKVLSVVGGNIRSIRKEYKMSINELANKANMSSKYLQGVEVGKRNISVTNLDKIASVLKVSTGDLFQMSTLEKAGKISEIASLLKKYDNKQLDSIMEVISGLDNSDMTQAGSSENIGSSQQL